MKQSVHTAKKERKEGGGTVIRKSRRDLLAIKGV